DRGARAGDAVEHPDLAGRRGDRVRLQRLGGTLLRDLARPARGSARSDRRSAVRVAAPSLTLGSAPGRLPTIASPRRASAGSLNPAESGPTADLEQTRDNRENPCSPLDPTSVGPAPAGAAGRMPRPRRTRRGDPCSR